MENKKSSEKLEKLTIRISKSKKEMLKKMVEKSSNWYYYKAIYFEMKERVTKKWIFIRRRGKDRKEPGADNRSAGVQCPERRDVGKEEPGSEKLFHHRGHRGHRE